MIDLEARRAETEAKLATARRKAAEALLEGAKPDFGPMDALEHETVALGDVPGLLEHRKREASERARLARQAFLRERLGEVVEDYLNAIADIEAGTRLQADGTGRALKAAAEGAQVAHEMTGASAPLPLQAGSVATRTSGRISAVNGTVPGHRYRLGSIEWQGGGLYKPDDNWRDAEAALLSKHINPLMEKSNG